MMYNTPKPSKREQMDLIFREEIAKALRNHDSNLLVGRQQVILDIEPRRDILDIEPRRDIETFTLPQNGKLENPRPSDHLHNLKQVWVVCGYHKQAPTLQVDLLIGEYRTLPQFKTLGKREGLTWISPISTRS